MTHDPVAPQDPIVRQIEQIRGAFQTWRPIDGTHWEGCYTYHWACGVKVLLAEIDRLRADRERSRKRITDLEDVCRQLNQDKNTHFDQSCRNLQRAEAAEAEGDALRAERDTLRDWQCTVTAALRREGGACYADVPAYIRALRAEVDTLRAQLADQGWQPIETLPTEDGWYQAASESRTHIICRIDGQISELGMNRDMNEIGLWDPEYLLKWWRRFPVSPALATPHADKETSHDG